MHTVDYAVARCLSLHPSVRPSVCLSHAGNGGPAGSRTRSIELRHFQWPWTTPNPVFEVTLYFDAEYLINGWRYGHSYYGRRIGNRTQAFEWYQFEWPWVTSNPDFKVTIIQRQITQKWYNTELYLQWPTNRKSYMIYRTAPFSMTLNDSYPRFEGHAIFWRWISQKRDRIQI